MANKKSAVSESTVIELQNEAEEILAEVCEKFPHYQQSLAGTTIQLSGRLTSSAGNACPKRKQVGLSVPIFSLEENRGEYRNTVLHELAHIIAGPSVQSHGAEWRSIFLELGGNGKRTHQMRARGRHRKHLIRCEKCDETIEVGTRMKNSIAKGRREYLHVGCGGILICENSDPDPGVTTDSSTNKSNGWISDLSKKWQQGTLFRFFGSD